MDINHLEAIEVPGSDGGIPPIAYQLSWKVPIISIIIGYMPHVQLYKYGSWMLLVTKSKLVQINGSNLMYERWWSIYQPSEVLYLQIALRFSVQLSFGSILGHHWNMSRESMPEWHGDLEVPSFDVDRGICPFMENDEILDMHISLGIYLWTSPQNPSVQMDLSETMGSSDDSRIFLPHRKTSFRKFFRIQWANLQIKTCIWCWGIKKKSGAEMHGRSRKVNHTSTPSSKKKNMVSCKRFFTKCCLMHGDIRQIPWHIISLWILSYVNDFKSYLGVLKFHQTSPWNHPNKWCHA